MARFSRLAIVSSLVYVEPEKRMAPASKRLPAGVLPISG